jgi:two-component system chemotaxis sensor kinase CheA
MNEGIDPGLIQDFLTESSELVEKLDADLVRLESVAVEAERQDLLNAIFRALHTIKGAASFLALTSVTTFAHAAEDALNKMRKGEVAVTSEVMDALLRSTDVVRGMLDEIAAGEQASPGPQDLIDRLHAIAASAPGNAPGDTPGDAPGNAPQAQGGSPGSPAPGSPQALSNQELSPFGPRPLKLPPQKLDLVEFMAADLTDYGKQIDECLSGIKNHATRGDSAAHLAELLDGLEKTADFFELDHLTALVRMLAAAAPKIAALADELIDEVVIRLRGAKHLVEAQAQALTKNTELRWPLDTLKQRLESLAAGTPLSADLRGQHHDDVAALLVLDGVTIPVPAEGLSPGSPESAASAVVAAPIEKSPAAAAPDPAAKAGPKEAAAKDAAPKGEAAGPGVEQTIRVEVSRLEALLNMVGQLVLSKNRIGALSRRSRGFTELHEFAEEMAAASGELDRLTSELQVGVMRTRMQPLAKLFDRYPRVIRDMARMTNKKIDLDIVGKETEVDKSVLELLADPLVHILRNSADHGVESPDARLKKGKPETGTIRLTAEHQGSHVRVAISDDGKGLHRDVLGKKAVEKGICTQEQLNNLSDDDVFRFIFAAGFSTAEKVSDLSGRGVGMDVVRTNVDKLNGVINITSAKDQGTTIEILIPLTVAIMPAMLVGVGKHLYAIPLQSIVEIIRPEENHLHTVSGHPVVRLRDSVLPLIDLRKRLSEPELEDGGRFAVVVSIAGQQAGLIVDKLVGQQEIVIKPLDDEYTKGGPFSGATIRENGEVSLILDVIQLIRQAQSGISGGKITGKAGKPSAPAARRAA